jgi:hypothetical protein
MATADAPVKVYVVPLPPTRAKELDKLKQLIETGGCELVCRDDPIEKADDCIAAADVVVILICAETLGDPAVDGLVELASRLGKRVIGVWADDAKPQDLPSSIERRGDATIRLDPEEIERAVCGGQTPWHDPTGKQRPRPKTPRHKKK